MTDRAFEIALKTGAKIIRVFSYWRTVDPEQCFGRVCDALAGLAEKAAQHDLIIGLENEHACHIGTAQESARALTAVQHPNLQLVWDPANALVGGETPYPYGYGLLPKDRIVHVHAKDCHMDGHKPVWGPLGTRAVDWKGQVRCSAVRWLRRLVKSGNALARTGRKQDGSQHNLWMESARIGFRLRYLRKRLKPEAAAPICVVRSYMHA